MNRVAIIVLAAGFSSRFGENKLLWKLSGRPLCWYSINSSLKAHVAMTVVVTGRATSGHIPFRESVEIVENEDPSRGVSSSIATGVSYVMDRSEAALILPADMPLVNSLLLSKLISMYEMEHRIVACAVNARPYSPALFPSSEYIRLMGLSGDSGARRIIEESGNALLVETDPALLSDVDTVEDLKRVARLMRRYDEHML